MRITVQRDRCAARSDQLLERAYQLHVPPERKRLPRPPVLPRNPGTLVPDGERYGCQAYRHTIPDVVIDALERVRRREVARVVVSQCDLHATKNNIAREARHIGLPPP